MNDSTLIETMGDSQTSESKEFKVYRRRFAIMVTVLVLNISNAALWINYSPVATTVALYYDKPASSVNWFSLSYMVVSMPFTFISTYAIDRVGLKYGIYSGALLNFVGSAIRAIGTSGLFDDLDIQYSVSLTGQVISAMAQSFLLYIPTKVSQTWFPESQRAICTTVLAMSNPLGIVVAEATQPFIVDEKVENIPMSNYIWSALALFGLLLTIVSVTRAKPKTAPSLSEREGEKNRPPYLQQLKDAFTCVPYLFVFITMGLGVGIFNTIATLTQQLLCPLGYSDAFGGTLNAMMILMGFAGSICMGLYVDKSKLFNEVTKAAFGFSALTLIFLLEFYLVPDQKAALLVFGSIFGFFAIGAYPVGLELGVEVTYPVEETISTAFVFLAGQIFGIIGIAMIPALASQQSDSTSYKNVCKSSSSYKDYTIPLMVIMVVMSVVVCSMIIFMNPTYKRLAADKGVPEAFPNTSGAKNSISQNQISSEPIPTSL